MKFLVEATEGGKQADVEAVDWMMAMAQATPILGIEVSGWMCVNQPDGRVQVFDPMTGASWMVTRLATEAPAMERVARPSPGAPTWKPSTKPVTQPVVASNAPPESVIAEEEPPRKLPKPAPKRAPEPMKPPEPVRPHLGAVTRMWAPSMATSLAPPEEPPEPAPEDLAETLFDLSTDIYQAANGNAACRLALDMVNKLIPCEAGSVLRGTREDGNLSFVACTGPAAAKLIGQKMYMGQGVVGASFDLGITIQVSDASADTRHNATFDQKTGFKTKGLLCVPIRQQGQVYGVLELVNPTKRFEPWHVEVMETVSRQLAGLLAVSR